MYVQKSNAFFHYTNLNQRLNYKLKLSEILERVDVRQRDSNGNSNDSGMEKYGAVSDWYNMCREVCLHTSAFSSSNKCDSLRTRFTGKRKYHRGRMLGRVIRVFSLGGEQH